LLISNDVAKKKEKQYTLPITHKVLFRFRSNFNVFWNTEINGLKGLTYMRGFPGTMYFTNRRILIVAMFSEKMGWFRRKRIVKFGFEAGLHKVKDWSITKDQKGFLIGGISFYPHGMLGDTVLTFIRLEPSIAKMIQDFFSNKETIKKPIEDSGIVYFGEDPVQWANNRFEKSE